MAHSPPHRTAKVAEPEPRWSWHCRLSLLIAMILVPLMWIWIYVGPNWPVVFFRLFTDGGIALLWLGAATGLGMLILSRLRLCHPQSPGALRWATAAALGLGILSLAVLGLGLLGWLNAFIAWALLAGGWILGAISPATLSPGAGAGALRNWFLQPARWAWLWLMATPFIALALTAAMAPPLLLWTPNEPHGYDVVEYHLQVPREWYEARRIIPLDHNVFSYLPFNVEMHYLLAMHLRGGPWAGMYLAQLMHLIFFALLVAAVYGFARRRASGPASHIAALSLLTVPWLTQLSAIAYDEGGFLLFGILAIGWGMIAAFESIGRAKRFALAGLMAGFAAGSKLTAVPEVLVAVPVVLGLIGIALIALGRREIIGKTFWPGLVIFGLTGLLSFSPWLIRNFTWARNPVFPEMLSTLGAGDFTTTQVERFEKAHRPTPAQQRFPQRLKAFGREVLGVWPAEKNRQSSAWQFGYLILPLALAAFAFSIRRPESWCLLGLLLVLTLFWLLMTHLQSRFYILAAPIAAMLIAEINWRRGAIAGLLLVIIFASMGWTRMNSIFCDKLYGSGNNTGAIVSTLGMDGVSLYEQFMPPDLPKTGKVFLVGDARAFLYPIPMARLRYRTVFDVKDGRDIVQAWIGDEPIIPGDCVVIDPGELRRFHQTYFGLPPLPANVERANLPFVIRH